MISCKYIGGVVTCYIEEENVFSSCMSVNNHKKTY